MKTQELLQLLNENKEHSLLFEYAPGQLVGANYHITEVKHITIDSVDCGAAVDNWNETIIQLWESPKELDKTEFMSVQKGLDILLRVGSMKPYDLEAEVKFEYSNEHFHTAQLFVNDFELTESKLTFKLGVEKTDCKAKESCDTPELESVLASEASCSPNGGCC